MDQRESPLILSKKKLAPLVSKLLRAADPRDARAISFQYSMENERVSWALFAGEHPLLEPKKVDFVSLTLVASLVRALHEHAPLLWATIVPSKNDRFDLSIPHTETKNALFALEPSQFILRCHPPDLEFTIATFQAILADSLQLMLDEIFDQIKDRKLTHEELSREVYPLLQRHIRASLPIEGKGERAFHAFSAWKEKKTARVFEAVLTEEALQLLYERKVKEYVQAMEKELKQKKEIPEEVKKWVEELEGLGWEAKGRVFCELIGPKMEKL